MTQFPIPESALANHIANRPIHGGYPDVTRPGYRPIMLQIAAADDEAKAREQDWRMFAAPRVDLDSFFAAVDYAAACAGWPPMSDEARSRLRRRVEDPLAVYRTVEPIMSLLALGASVHNAGGNCPVQVTGEVDGNYFYFRARGEHWQFEVAKNENEWLADNLLFRIEKQYGTEPYSAGWMPLHEAFGFVAEAIAAFREAQPE